MSETQPAPSQRDRLPLLLVAIAIAVLLIASGVVVAVGQAGSRGTAEVTASATTPAPSVAATTPPTPSATPTPSPAPATEPAAAGESSPAAPATLPPAEPTEYLTPVPTRAISVNTGSYPGPAFPSVTEVPPPAPLIPIPEGVTNILLVGNDKRPDDAGLRTDTLIIVSVNAREGTVNMISLPRDMLVYVPGWKMERINTVWAHASESGASGGGFGLMQETLLYNLGVYVGHYAMVDLSGFQGIVDALGGVELPVDCGMEGYVLTEPRLRQEDFPTYDEWVNYTDPDSGNWEVYRLPPGMHELDGYMALWYARWRKGLDDFDRSYRQQQVLRAILSRARQNGLLNLGQVSQLWREYNDLVDTSMGLSNALELAPVAANLDQIEIRSYVVTRDVLIPWDNPETEGLDYYQLPNPEAIQNLMYFAMQPPAQNYVVSNTVTVEVRNASGVPRMDEVAADRLGWFGISATATGDVPAGETYGRTVIYDFTGQERNSQLERMQREMRVLGADIFVEPDPNRTFDYLVILGENYTSCTRRPEQAPASTLPPPPTPGPSPTPWPTAIPTVEPTPEPGGEQTAEPTPEG